MDKKDKKILVVDDEVNIIKALSYTLKKHGWTIFEAMDGKTALDIVLKESPDIIFLDVMLPDMDGFEICRRIKADTKTKQIHVIMLTATRILESEGVAGVECGADMYILKPFSMAEIVAQVEKILGR
jgi:DNA-binding response OmpR family regulator